VSWQSAASCLVSLVAPPVLLHAQSSCHHAASDTERLQSFWLEKTASCHHAVAEPGTGYHCPPVSIFRHLRPCGPCIYQQVLGRLSCILWEQEGPRVGSTTHTHTHPFNGPFSGTTQVSRYQKGKTKSGFYWSKRQWVAVASAGPYARLHCAPDRQPCQHPTTQFFTGRMPCLPPNQQRQSTEGIFCYWLN